MNFIYFNQSKAKIKQKQKEEAKLLQIINKPI